MAFDEGVAHRVREALDDQRFVEEKRMFGGLAFMLRGHMCIGVVGDHLMVRVGPDQYADSLRQPHVREMDFTGKALRGFVFVEPAGFDSDDDLMRWVDRALAFNRNQAAK